MCELGTWIVDVAIVVVMALFVLAGIVRGLSRSTKGFFVTLFIMMAALLLMGFTHPAAMRGPMGTNIEQSLNKASENWGAAYTSPVLIHEDGSKTLLLEGKSVSFDELDSFGERVFAKFLAKTFVQNNEKSIAQEAVYNITSLCVLVILYVIFIISFLIVFAIIKAMTKNMAKSEKKGVRGFDRILGAIFCAFIGFVFVSLILAIFAALEDRVPSIAEYVKESVIGKALYESNPIGNVFREIFTKKS